MDPAPITELRHDRIDPGETRPGFTPGSEVSIVILPIYLTTDGVTNHFVEVWSAATNLPSGYIKIVYVTVKCIQRPIPWHGECFSPCRRTLATGAVLPRRPGDQSVSWPACMPIMDDKDETVVIKDAELCKAQEGMKDFISFFILQRHLERQFF